MSEMIVEGLPTLEGFEWFLVSDEAEVGHLELVETSKPNNVIKSQALNLRDVASSPLFLLDVAKMLCDTKEAALKQKEVDAVLVNGRVKLVPVETTPTSPPEPPAEPKPEPKPEVTDA